MRRLTTPVGVGQADVDLAVQLSIQPPQDSGQQHQAADDQSTGDENVAQQQLRDHPGLQHARDGHLAVSSSSSMLAPVPEGLHVEVLHSSESEFKMTRVV